MGALALHSIQSEPLPRTPSPHARSSPIWLPRPSPTARRAPRSHGSRMSRPRSGAWRRWWRASRRRGTSFERSPTSWRRSSSAQKLSAWFASSRTRRHPRSAVGHALGSPSAWDPLPAGRREHRRHGPSNARGRPARRLAERHGLGGGDGGHPGHSLQRRHPDHRRRTAVGRHDRRDAAARAPAG